ncbi:hypothetical protein DAPPUDRAFT_15719, partial [Daphnia pulex]
EVNERDYQGNTALHYTVLNASEKTVVILSMSGADVTIQNSDGQTVIHLLAFSHDNNLAKHLLAKIPHINLVDDSGHSALALAISHGNEVAVDILLLQEADIKQTDNSGNLMLNIACAGPSIHIARHML